MPPITLTKQQFLKRRPQGKYENYLRYIAAHRAAHPAAVQQGITPDQLSQRIAATLLSPAQQKAQASWIVNQAFSQQQRALTQASQEEQQTAERQAKAAEGFAQALGPMQSSFDQSIRNAYAQGAGGISSDVSSLAAANQAAQQNALAQANADVARIAPVEGGVPGGNPAAGAAQLTGNAAFAAGVPAASAGSYFSGASPVSARVPGSPYVTPSAARAADIGSEYRYKAIQSATDLRKAIANLQADRPTKLREAMSSFGDQNLQTLAALSNVLTLQNTMRSTSADITAQTAATKLAKQKFNLDTVQGRRDYMASQGMNLQGEPLPGFYRAPNGTIQKVPQYYTVGKGGKLKPAPYPAGAAGAKGTKTKTPSLTDVRNIRSDMLTTGRTRLGLDKQFTKPKKMSLVQIANYLMASVGSSYVDIYGDQAKVQQWVQQAARQLYNEMQARLKPTTGAGGKKKG